MSRSLGLPLNNGEVPAFNTPIGSLAEAVGLLKTAVG